MTPQEDVEVATEDVLAASSVKLANVPEINILHGQEALSTLLRKLQFNTSPILHSDTFLAWVRELCKRKMDFDETFRARRVVQNIRRSHRHELKIASAAVDSARKQWEVCPQFARYRHMEKEVGALHNTLEGILKSKHPPHSAKHDRMMNVFEASTTKLAQNQQGMNVIENTTPEYIT